MKFLNEILLDSNVPLKNKFVNVGTWVSKPHQGMSPKGCYYLSLQNYGSYQSIGALKAGGYGAHFYELKGASFNSSISISTLSPGRSYNISENCWIIAWAPLASPLSNFDAIETRYFDQLALYAGTTTSGTSEAFVCSFLIGIPVASGLEFLYW